MTEYVCEGCGDTTQGEAEWDNWDCVVCGERVKERSEAKTVPKEELRALVEQWREQAETSALRNGGDRYNECADELEQVLEE